MGTQLEQQKRGEVLIVEDTPASLKLLSDLLGEAGYHVRQAPNGELALWTAQSRPPELILLDIRMPGIDGFEVCRRLKANPALAAVPVIFLSAQHDTEDRVRGFALGAVDFIAKPFHAEEVLARTDAHVRLARVQQALTAERALLEQRVAERTADLAASAAALALEVERRRANEELLLLASQVFEATQDAIVIADRDGMIIATNPAFSRISGYAAAEVRGRHASLLHASPLERPAYEGLLGALERGGRWSGEILARRRNGETYTGLLSVTLVRDGAGAPLHYIGVFIDISERKAEQHLIELLSNYDALTGLPNRLLARRRFSQAMTVARREGQRVAVLCLDLDRFRSVNDSFGPQVGDQLLQTVAQYLSRTVRDGDTVTRQGGDEFQVILQDDSQLSATLALAQTILAGLRRELQVDGQQIALTSSIGIAVSPNDGNSFDELVRNAETALSRAKEDGRDHYAFFTEGMDAEVRERLAIVAQLRGAIARDEFSLQFQPQLCLHSGAVIGAEALLRWDNAVLGRVAPARFISLAEEFGLITLIGQWVLESVCAQIRSWQQQGIGTLKISVNLAASQFAHASTLSFIEEVLRRYEVAPASLGLEITESTVMGDPDRSVAALARLKAIGVSIALDDFGTGYSSLAYLKRLPIDVLKIDKSFIDDAATHASDAAIVLSIISLGHNLQMRVVAEGVQTRAQAAFLSAHGCDDIQGNYFSAPLDVAGFTAMLLAPPPELALC